MAHLAVVGNLHATQTCPAASSGEPPIWEDHGQFQRQASWALGKNILDFPNNDYLIANSSIAWKILLEIKEKEFFKDLN